MIKSLNERTIDIDITLEQIVSNLMSPAGLTIRYEDGDITIRCKELLLNYIPRKEKNEC